MKSTPGPWINDNGLVNGQETRARFAPGVLPDIFDSAQWPKELQEEAMANAALISAAPDLLEALKKIAGGLINSDFALSTPPNWHNAFRQLQATAVAAIAKAEAPTNG